MSYSWKGASALYIMNWVKPNIICISLEEYAESYLFFLQLKMGFIIRDFSHVYLTVKIILIKAFRRGKIAFCFVKNTILLSHILRKTLILISLGEIYSCHSNHSPHFDVCCSVCVQTFQAEIKHYPTKNWVGSCLLFNSLRERYIWINVYLSWGCVLRVCM